MKPTLLILAAGLGNRFGGLKQVIPVGPKNELLIDYSIYDAIMAGFKKVVFVIRKSFYQEFRKKIGAKVEKSIETQYVFQELDNETDGSQISSIRQKPWGTGHAVLVSKKQINDHFCVINSDDYYGPSAYQKIIQYFNETAHGENDYAVIGYKISKTLSKYGSVSRGVCEYDEQYNLVKIIERSKIQKVNGDIFFWDNQKRIKVNENQLISMNIWGLKKGVFDYFQEEFNNFLSNNFKNDNSEFYIPYAINTLLEKEKIRVKIIPSSNEWFGITYKEDLEDTISQIRILVEKGVYPKTLF